MSKKVYLGSTNNVKLKACQQVLEPLGYEVIGIQVDSLIGVQPLNDEMTILGAENRAQALPNDGIRIGLEAGVNRRHNQCFLTNFGVLIDENNNYFYAGGTQIVLPKMIEDALFNDHLELSVAMEKYFNMIDIKHHEGAIGFFTKDLVVRQDIFVHLVKLLYGQYLKKKEKTE